MPDDAPALTKPSLTIITSSDEAGKPTGWMTKRVTAEGVKGHTFPPTYTSRAPELGSIFDLAGNLDVLASMPHSCVIRGRKLDTAPTVHRRIAAIGDKNRAYEPQACQWFCTDIDKVPLELLGCEPGTFPLVLARKAVQLFLPPIFHGVTFYFQASSSHGYKKKEDVDKASMHLWHWLDRPLTDEEYKKYILQLNRAARVEYCYEGRIFDPALAGTVQPHFTADPILDPGIEPLPYPRRGLDRHAWHVVPIAAELDLLTGNWQRHLDQFGENRQGFWRPILGATGCYVREHGKAGLLPAPREALKEKIRQAIDLADKGSRSPDEIARYKSDSYIDRALEDAEDKGFGQAGLDEAAEGAGLDYIWVRDVSKFYHKKNRVFQSTDGVRLEFRATKDVTRNKHFLAQIQQVDRVQAIPGRQDCLVIDEGQTVWSNWPGRKTEPTHGDVGWFLDHVGFICTDTPAATEPLLDWLANLLGNPGKRARWAVVIGSTYGGIGKTMIADLLDELIHGIKPLTNNDLTEKFKDYTDTELAICAEVKISEKLNATDLLKSIITDDKLHVRKFGKPHAVMTLYCHHFFTTNYKDALPLQQGGDRRYLVIWNDQKPKEREYYRRLGKFIEEHSSDVLGWAIERCKTMQFDRYAAPPVTGHALEMAELARPGDEQIIARMIEERQPPFDFTVWFTTEVQSRLKLRCSPQRLIDLVGRNGGQYLRVNGEAENGRRTKRGVFIFDDAGEGIAGKTENDLFALAMEETKRRSDHARRQREQDEAGIEVARRAALRLVDKI